MGTATIAATDANRRFSEVLRRVRAGHSYTVTSHGRPVAQIVPAGHAVRATASGRAALLKRLGNTPCVNVGKWTRDELYE